jgi:hypothetical protein
MPHDATIIGEWYDHTLPAAEFVIGSTMYHSYGIILRHAPVSVILMMYWHVGINQGKLFGKFSIFELDALHHIGCALAIIQDALYTAMTQAFEIGTFDFFFRNVEPCQQSASLE